MFASAAMRYQLLCKSLEFINVRMQSHVMPTSGSLDRSAGARPHRLGPYAHCTFDLTVVQCR